MVQVQQVIDTIPSIREIAVVGGISAVIAFAFTDVVRKVLRAMRTDTDDRLWWQAGLRLVAIIFGGGAGFMLRSWPWGVAMGACGGALSAAVVKVIRKRLALLAEKK